MPTRSRSDLPPASNPGESFTMTDGCRLLLRPIRDSDADALLRAFSRLTPQQIRLRVFHPMSELSTAAVGRLCHPDPATAAGYVAIDAEGEIRADGRFYADAGNSAEFALIVDPAMTGIGIGRALMQKLIDEGRARRLDELWGVVLIENTAMLDLAATLGARNEVVPGEPGVVRVFFDLRATSTRID